MYTTLIRNLSRVLFWEPQKRTSNRPGSSPLFIYVFIFVGLDSGLVRRAIGRKQVSRKQPEMWRKYDTSSKKAGSTTIPFHILG